MKRERLIPLALTASALLAVTACSSDGPTTTSSDPTRTTTATPSTSPGTDTGSSTTTSPRTQPQGFGSARLNFFGDCPALLDYMQDAATARVTPWGLGGGGFYYDDVLRAEGELDMAVADSAEAAPAPTAGGDGTYSGTNTQEVGVDEGDIVETDGDYVYVATNDGVRIVSVVDADIVAEPELPQGSHQLLLDGSRLLVATSSWSGSADTIVSLFDVSDPTNPSLLRRTHLEGATVATRSIDGVARFVISSSFDQRLPFVQPNQFGLDEESALERNKQIIENSTVQDWLPRSFDENGDGSFGPMSPILACEDVAAPAEFSGLGLTWIASIDSNGTGDPVGSAGIVSTGDTVYASTDNLYIATQNWEWQWGGPVPLIDDTLEMSAVDAPAVEPATEATPEPDTAPTTAEAPATTEPTDPSETTETPQTTEAPETTVAETTTTTEVAVSTTEPSPPVEDPGPPPTLIHQFSLDAGTGATYVASGEVEGRLLNQFAMSEYNGDLRVATTTDDWGNFGDQSESTVFVLRPNGTDLEQISSISGLGKGEQIYAVRFIEDKGYVVTFRQIDPLYVLDLSDPENPVLEGELKIPGYSAYLHPVGDGLLLGVGQDATEEGRTTGTQLSLFDISDPSNPQRISTLPIGGHSDVEWDHKAFLYWQPDGTIVLPVSPGWNDCGPFDDCLAKEITGAGGGAVVAELQGRELVARGVITHGTTNSHGCWNPLQRSIVIGDEIVTVGLDQVQFSDRDTLVARDSVSWGDPEQYGCYWYVD
ncbi:MAG: beta-propeller domain-containing protein [Ilumatobacteraceae bacterium]